MSHLKATPECLRRCRLWDPN